MSSGKVGALLLAIVMIVGLAMCVMCIETIPAGYVGIVYKMNGGIADDVLTQGMHLVSPTKKITEYSVGLEQSYLTSDDKGDSPKDESFNTPTSDGKTVRVDLEFSYKFDVERLPETFSTFKGQSGKQIKDSFIKPKVAAWTQEVTAQYPVTDLFGDKRTEINEKLDVYLREKFDQYGIVIDTVNFTNIEVDAETAEKIQQKVDAQQERELATIQAETAQIEAEKNKQVALIEAEKNKATAEIQAEQKRITAEAEAEAMRIKAEAEAEANREIAASLTSALIEKLKYERWDGSVPQFSGTGVTPIVTID